MNRSQRGARQKADCWEAPKDASLILKLAVGVISITFQTFNSTITWYSAQPPCLLLLATAAAAVATAYTESKHDDASHDPQSDDQSFKVDPTHPPSGLGQRAQRGRGY